MFILNKLFINIFLGLHVGAKTRSPLPHLNEYHNYYLPLPLNHLNTWWRLGKIGCLQKGDPLISDTPDTLLPDTFCKLHDKKMPLIIFELLIVLGMLQWCYFSESFFSFFHLRLVYFLYFQEWKWKQELGLSVAIMIDLVHRTHLGFVHLLQYSDYNTYTEPAYFNFLASTVAHCT